MTPYYRDSAAGIEIYHGDCREVLSDLDCEADLILTDPPYGIGYDPSTSTQQGIKRFAAIVGDGELFDPRHLLGYPDVILWGCNNFCNAIPPQSGQWYFWDKVTQNSLRVRIAEGEYCWHKLGTKPRAFRHLWSGAYRASEANQSSLHPTQKPLALMKWCIEQSPRSGVIVDPYCGSGTTLVAAKFSGRRAIGIEIEERYCEIAAKRLEQGVLDFAAAGEMPLIGDRMEAKP